MKKQLFFTFIVILSSLMTYPQQKLSLWSEDFEENWSSRWYSDAGIWEVGTPTIGPGAAHEGNNCATVGLNGNYPTGVDSKFIRINSFTIPDATLSPRLRFWHWWDIGMDDYGIVQIKESGSSEWVNISPNYGGTGGNIWNYAFLDLTPYAGKTVQLAFYFHSAYYYEGPGWYIDDVSIETGQINFSFPEGFEQGMGNWYSDFGTWQVGTPAIGPGGAHGGNNCAAVGLTNNYLTGVNSRLISSYFTIPDATINPRLRFWHWWDIGMDDYGTVQIKEDDSSEWVNISPNYGGTGGNIWNYAFLDLTPYAGKTLQLAFYFHSAYYYEGPGWYIDDVSIETGQIYFSFPEGFEEGMGNWYSDFGTWQVGTPTIGPGGAHGGNNCATVGLNSNYLTGVDSRLISPSFTIPDATLNPRLRFWHWWEIGMDDYGIVQIKENDSSEWVNISPVYAGTGGNIWNYAFLDLTPYGGKTVQLAFYFHSAYYYEGPGWYIDDINLEDNTVGFFDQEATGIGAADLNIYPNPATNILNIHFEGNQSNVDAQLRIYDPQSKAMISRQIKQVKSVVDISELHPGVYIIRVKYGQNLLTRKLTVY